MRVINAFTSNQWNLNKRLTRFEVQIIIGELSIRRHWDLEARMAADAKEQWLTFVRIVNVIRDM